VGDLLESTANPDNGCQETTNRVGDLSGSITSRKISYRWLAASRVGGGGGVRPQGRYGGKNINMLRHVRMNIHICLYMTQVYCTVYV
jgi:hypothetical protein